MQKDLFGGAAAAVSLPDMNARLSFLDRYRMALRLDQALFLLIGLLVIYVLVFSFGVETGKRYAMDELRSERMKRERLADELRSKVISNMENLAATATAAHATTVAAAPVKKQAVAAATNAAIISSVTAVEGPETVAETPAVAETVEPAAGKFTIQILTVASKQTAEKEVKRLTEKGMKAFIIPRGKKSEICINAFESREKASRNLKDLKTRGVVPVDAYVRPIAA